MAWCAYGINRMRASCWVKKEEPALPTSSSPIRAVVVRTSSTASRPALRAVACGGRPRAGSATTATGAPASPSRQATRLPQRPQQVFTPESARDIPRLQGVRLASCPARRLQLRLIHAEHGG